MQTRTASLAIAAAGVAAVLLAIAPAAPGGQSTSLAGGTYRVGWEQIGFTGVLDPMAGFPDLLGVYSNLLLRTLVGTNHVAGAAGTTLVPDLATRVPEPTDGGRTYTFELKRGIRFGPPVNRQITSRDIRYAIERYARAKGKLERSDPYLSYLPSFVVIRGHDAYRRGRATSISGIETPNAKRITFRLTRPTGDFLHRLTLPMAAPMPPEVARCFDDRPKAYGLDLISSGPYMVEGSDAVDISSCGAIRPMRGVSETQLTLVRNPRYDPRTDSRAARENNPDRFVFVAIFDRGGTRNTAAIVKKVVTGEFEDAILLSSKTLREHAARAAKRGRLRVNAAHWLEYMTLNLTQPPFDDVHVRRALSWVVDKAALREIGWGGPLAGAIAHHLVPDTLLDGKLDGFAPFKTPGDHGDLARARAEMAKSKYATRNGFCIAKACKAAYLAPLLDCPCYAAGQRIAPLVRESAAKLGIALAQHSFRFDRFLDPSRNIPMVVNADYWVAGPSDPSIFVDRLFSGTSIARSTWNASLVGITPAQAARLGIKGRVKGVPSVDADIAGCSALAGPERIGCYARLDRKLTAEVVPAIPLVWRSRINILGPQVATWAFDQSSGMTSFAHVALKR